MSIIHTYVTCNYYNYYAMYTCTNICVRIYYVYVYMYIQYYCIVSTFQGRKFLEVISP